MDFGMHKRISIFRSKIEDTDLNRDSDMSFSTGENLKHIIDSIKPYADDCTIYMVVKRWCISGHCYLITFLRQLSVIVVWI